MAHYASIYEVHFHLFIRLFRMIELEHPVSAYLHGEHAGRSFYRSHLILDVAPRVKHRMAGVGNNNFQRQNQEILTF